MRAVGFSTGALAKGDFRAGLGIQRSLRGLAALELSALREDELAPLVEAVGSLDLAGIRYLSVHAPSKLRGMSEQETIDLLMRLPESCTVVAHPDVIRTPARWTVFATRLCIENMDGRKAIGRTAEELLPLFEQLPAASFCFDVGHAKQVDPSLEEARKFLDAFSDRLRQVHVSAVGPAGEHRSLATENPEPFRQILSTVPQDCAVIIESVIESLAAADEVEWVRLLFHG